MPYTSTGPAMVNSFAAIPKINPSLLNSIAGDTMALAKPVNRNDGACAGVFCQFIIQMQTGQQCAKEYHRNCGCSSGAFCIKAAILIKS